MKYLVENKAWRLAEDYNIDKLLYLLIDRPTDIFLGSFFWENDNSQRHRNYDLPSQIICNNNFVKMYWDNNNKLHRKNKPAIISSDGQKEYHING